MERIIETVERFEEDLTDYARPHGPMRAIVQVGEAIEISPVREKGPAGDPLMNRIRERIEAMLADLGKDARLVDAALPAPPGAPPPAPTRSPAQPPRNNESNCDGRERPLMSPERRSKAPAAYPFGQASTGDLSTTQAFTRTVYAPHSEQTGYPMRIDDWTVPRWHPNWAIRRPRRRLFVNSQGHLDSCGQRR